MKKLKTLAISLLALSIGLGGVNAATETRSIDKTKCDTVYTNYYFFQSIYSKEYLNKAALNTYTQNTIAEYNNNSWQVNNFDPNNIGYGQVELGQGTITSSDGITSMSLNDYYTHTETSYKTNGSYTNGSNNYIVAHGWYKVDENNNEIKQTAFTDLKSYSKKELSSASLDADITFTRRTPVDPNAENPFKIQIQRRLKGYLTDGPIYVNNKANYVQPAVYYIQYCSPKSNTVIPEKEYTVRYHGNGSNVNNVPGNQTYKENSCFTVSNGPTRQGYKFLGWSTTSSATVAESKFAPGKEICNYNQDLDLYAVWEVENTNPVDTFYKVSYDANTNDNVSGMPDNVEINTKNDYTISSNIPVRDGFIFVGWHTDKTADVGSDEFKGGSLYQDRKDLKLYAIWKKVGNNKPENPDNPKTAINDYLLPFGGTVGLSGLGLGVLKKKKTFKQF